MYMCLPYVPLLQNKLAMLCGILFPKVVGICRRTVFWERAGIRLFFKRRCVLLSLSSIPVSVALTEHSKNNPAPQAMVQSSAGITSVLKSVYRSIRILLRTLRLAVVFGGLCLMYPLFRVHRSGVTVWWNLLLWAVESSGPTVLKLGQWASTRRDLFSLEFCEKFSKLHRHTREHSWSQTQSTLRKHFGHNWRDQFHSFDSKPIGCGCVAQVYAAETAASNRFDLTEATKVAVKINHPGILESVRMDLAILRGTARLLQTLFPSLSYLNFVKCVEEFRMIMEKQVDLRVEAESLERFAANFDKNPSIHFPKVFYSSTDLIVESFQDGIHVGELIGEKERAGVSQTVKKQLAVFGARALLKMIFVDNFVHGDLHPGNVLVRFSEPNSSTEMEKQSFRSGIDRLGWWMHRKYLRLKQLLTGTFGGLEYTDKPVSPPMEVVSSGEPSLIFLDTGITVSLEPKDLTNFRSLFRAVVEGDGEEVGKLLLSQAPQEWCTNPEDFRHDIARLVEIARRKTVSLAALDVSRLLSDLLSVVSRHRVGLESNFTCVVLAVMVLEGLGRTLDPNLDLLDCARPYLFAL